MNHSCPGTPAQDPRLSRDSRLPPKTQPSIKSTVWDHMQCEGLINTVNPRRFLQEVNSEAMDDEDDASNLEGEQTWNEMAGEVEPLVRGPAMVPQHQLPQSQTLPSLTKFDTKISASLHHPFQRFHSQTQFFTLLSKTRCRQDMESESSTFKHCVASANHEDDEKSNNH